MLYAWHGHWPHYPGKNPAAAMASSSVLCAFFVLTGALKCWPCHLVQSGHGYRIGLLRQGLVNRRVKGRDSLCPTALAGGWRSGVPPDVRVGFHKVILNTSLFLFNLRVLPLPLSLLSTPSLSLLFSSSLPICLVFQTSSSILRVRLCVYLTFPHPPAIVTSFIVILNHFPSLQRKRHCLDNRLVSNSPSFIP